RDRGIGARLCGRGPRPGLPDAGPRVQGQDLTRANREFLPGPVAFCLQDRGSGYIWGAPDGEPASRQEQMTDIFREVDEDLRREQLKKLWDRYGSYVLGVAILIVIATAGYRFWQYWQDSQAQASGDRFVAALKLADTGKHSDAISALTDLSRNGSGDYPVLAGF